MVIGGFITMVDTQYRPDTDLVFRFYAKFNPCIFFDHFPANLWGMLLIAMFLYFELAMLLFVYLHRTSLIAGTERPEKRPCTDATFLCLMGPIALTFCLFINIFTSNLYENHDYSIYNATKILSTNHPNATALELQQLVGNLTKDQRDGVSKEIFEAVTVHTNWFILYIVGDILFAVLLWRYANRLRTEHSWTYQPTAASTTMCCHRDTKCWSWTRFTAYIIYLIGVPSFCLSLTIILFAYDGRNRLVEDRMWKEGTPILQSVMVWFKQTANAASWFALPMLFHHFFVVPPGFALKIKLSLKNNDDNDDANGVGVVRDRRERGIVTSLRPEILLSKCLAIFTVALITTFTFHQSNFRISHRFDQSSEAKYPLAEGFQSKPWAFIFAPLWFGIMGMIILSSFLMQWRTNQIISSTATATNQLNNLFGWRCFITKIIWCLMIFSGLACLWLVIPDQSLWTILIIWGMSLPLFLIATLTNVRWEHSTMKQKSYLIFHLLMIFIGGSLSTTFVLPASTIFLLFASTIGYVVSMTTSMPALQIEIWPTTADDAVTSPGSSTKLSCCNCRCCGRSLSCVYIFFVCWQLMNLPMYAGLMVLPATSVTNATLGGNTFGMELAPMANYLWGQRGLKIFVDPYLFLGPHSIMGTALLSIWIAVLRGWMSKETAGKYFFPILFPFCFHILPVSKGIPNRTRNGLPINELSCVMCLIGAVIGLFVSHNSKLPTSMHVTTVRGRQIINFAYGICLIPLIGAPAASMFYTVTFVRARASLGYWIGPEGELPSIWSGDGPYALGTSPVVAFIICFFMLVGFVSLLYWSWKRGDWNMNRNYKKDESSTKQIMHLIQQQQQSDGTGIEMKNNVENGNSEEIENPVRATTLRGLRVEQAEQASSIIK